MILQLLLLSRTKLVPAAVLGVMYLLYKLWIRNPLRPS
ncbi:hypothetical protein [Aeromonas phage Akh-2]|nr:hypothetical protein [Aeromonas phage Akh-2]